MAHNNKTWYEKAVFYHMYPLGMTGAPKQNIETEAESRFGELKIKSLIQDRSAASSQRTRKTTKIKMRKKCILRLYC